MARAKIAAEGALSGRGIIIEMIPVGQFMKVTAFDERSLTEVSISGPVDNPVINFTAKRIEASGICPEKKRTY